MADVAALGFEINSAPLTQASTAMDKMSASARTLQDNVTGTKSASAQLSKEVDTLVARTNAATGAHAGLSTQALAAQHSIRSLVESVVAGASPTQALALQLNHLSYAASGPGGLTGAFGQVGASLKNMISPTTLVLGGLAAVGIGAGLALHSMAELAKQFDDTARAAGTSVSNLQSFASAASFKGIGNTDFLTSMDKFAASVYQAQHNMGGLKEVFTANNVQAKTFDDYLLKASDLIKNAQSDQARLQLLQQMGLPATMDWVRFLSQGADGIKRAQDEAVKFGGDAETQMIAKARQFDEEWSKATTNLGNYFKNAVLNGSTGLQTLIDKANDLITKGLMKAGVNVGANLLTNAALGGPTPSSRLTSTSDVSQYYAGLGTGAPGNSGPQTIDKNALQETIRQEQTRVGLLGQTPTVQQPKSEKDNRDDRDKHRVLKAA